MVEKTITISFFFVTNLIICMMTTLSEEIIQHLDAVVWVEAINMEFHFN